jgi:hypothetical protein
VKSTYPYSSMQNSLVASKLEHDENNFDVSHSSFFSSSIPSSPVSSTSPLPFSPFLSPACIQHSSRTYSPASERYRLQIVPSPPPVTQTSSPVRKTTDDRMNSPVILRVGVDLHGNCKRKTSKSKAKISTGPQQQILIVNSLQSLNSLTERSAITLMNKNSILNLLSRSDLVGQSSVSKQTNGE